MFGYVITVKSVKNYPIILLFFNRRTFYKNTTVLHNSVNLLILDKIKVASCDLDYGGIYFNISDDKKKNGATAPFLGGGIS